MPRNMSFAMTTSQFRMRTKDVTRRFGWWFLNSGDVLCGVEKAMGLKKGEKINRLGLIEVVSTRAEPLNAITYDDVIREGFPDYTPEDFIAMLVSHYRVSPQAEVNRIEYRYLAKQTELIF